MLQAELDLKELVNIEDWQKIQDLFSDVLDVTLRTISVKGKLLTNISRLNYLCAEILPKGHSRSELCRNYMSNIEQAVPLDIMHMTEFECMLGLRIFVVPIKAAGDIITAYMVVGPLILKNRKSISEYNEQAKAFGITLDVLMDAIVEVNVFSYSKIYAIVKLIEGIFSHMAQTGYHKKRLGQIAPEIKEMDPMFSRYYEEKVLNALLNTCSLALDADSGSVMTLDKATNTLNIKVASRLDDDIKTGTNIKVGDGIAGLAAATSQPIILPKDENKIDITGRMKRKYIKSSMIIPFNKENAHELYGVINLNMVRKDKDFSEKDIALVKELIGMASIALAPLQNPA